MALHRNIGYIREDGLPPTDLQLEPVYDINNEVIVIDNYFPKDPILPAELDENVYSDVKPEDALTTVQTMAVEEITTTTSYARGIVFDDKTKSPIKSSVELIDIATGLPVSAPQAMEAGHQFLIWTNNPDYRAIKITAEGFGKMVVPFNQFVSVYPGALEIYLNKSGNNTMLLVALAGVFLVASRKKKKKTVGKIDVYKYYEGLPPVAKGILTVGGAYLVYTVLDKLLTKPPPDDKEPEQAGAYLQQLAQQGIFPSYSTAQYESFSNAIVQAIWDCGTDEDAIYNVMDAMYNEADIYRLVQVYGVREYKGCFENFFSTVSRSLSGAISSELDASEKEHVNDILSSKGITFRFA